jgi:hypothetical protein
MTKTNANCARCGAPLVDRTTLEEWEGRTYCCTTCRAVASGQVHPATPGRPTCTHCQAPIADQAKQVERANQTFCCLNCAAAMTQTAAPAVGQGST